MFKKIILIFILVLVIPVVIYGVLVWQNNRSDSPPTQQEITASWERSILWLTENRQHVIQDRNPILWWMIGESAKLTDDSRLKSLLSEFRATMDPADPWQAFFEPDRYWGINISEANISVLPDYNQYFLFGLTCSKQLSTAPLIEAQNKTNFCIKNHPISPACVTHQLMGFRFAQRVGCDRVAGLPEKVAVLQGNIVSQLIWDPRVVDVYLQRVLMLVDSGAAERVKSRWLQRIIAAQLADGSWSNLQPLLPIGGGRYFGFDERLIGVGVVQGNLHATAQGLWLLSLMQQPSNYGAFSANKTNK